MQEASSHRVICVLDSRLLGLTNDLLPDGFADGLLAGSHDSAEDRARTRNDSRCGSTCSGVEAPAADGVQLVIGGFLAEFVQLIGGFVSLPLQTVLHVIQALVLEVAGPGLDVLFAWYDGTEAMITNHSGKLPDVLRGLLAAIDEA